MIKFSVDLKESMDSLKSSMNSLSKKIDQMEKLDSELHSPNHHHPSDVQSITLPLKEPKRTSKPIIRFSLDSSSLPNSLSNDQTEDNQFSEISSLEKDPLGNKSSIKRVRSTMKQTSTIPPSSTSNISPNRLKSKKIFSKLSEG